MDDERIRQLAEEVLLEVRGAVPGPGEAPSLEARVAAREAAVRERGEGARATVVVALAHPSHSLLGVSPGTLYNHIPDLRELRASAVPRQLEAPAR